MFDIQRKLCQEYVAQEGFGPHCLVDMLKPVFVHHPIEAGAKRAEFWEDPARSRIAWNFLGFAKADFFSCVFPN